VSIVQIGSAVAGCRGPYCRPSSKLDDRPSGAASGVAIELRRPSCGCLGLLAGRQALDRIGHGRDIASAIAWLAAEDNVFVTGAVIEIDGGFTLGLADRV
jgi:NAD(P)-dependent dehydrogenase (short-subunit alcohol dehydrogenase family)